MSMQSYISAHCRAAAYDPSYNSRDFFGGGEDDWTDTGTLISPTERVAEVLRGAAGALADDFELSKLYASSVRDPGLDQADIPSHWQSGIDQLDEVERRVLSNTLTIPVHNLGIATVGIVRRLPDTELVKAKGIGANRAAILKALGHKTRQETKLVLVVNEFRALDALKPKAIEELRDL